MGKRRSTDEDARHCDLFARVQYTARSARDVKHTALAAACGVSQSVISRREEPGGPQREGALESTAAGLGIGVRQLLLEVLAPEKLRGLELDPSEKRVLSQVVRATRAQRDESQEEFAARIGRHQTRVAAWESGKAPLSEATIYEIAEALGMTPADLVVQGLTYKPKAREVIDVDAVRVRYLAAVEGGVVPAQLAEELETSRSTLSRFGDGGSVSEDMARRIGRALDKLERAAKAA